MSDALEERLTRALEEQVRHYDQAHRVLDDADTSDLEAWASRLDAALDAVRTNELALAQDRAAWHGTGRKPGPTLSGVLARLAERVQSLAQRVDAEIALLLTRRQQMLPAIDLLMRQERMLKAYGGET